MRLQIIKGDFKYYHYYELQNFHCQVEAMLTRFGFLMSPFSPCLKINEINMSYILFLATYSIIFLSKFLNIINQRNITEGKRKSYRMLFVLHGIRHSPCWWIYFIRFIWRDFRQTRCSKLSWQ